MLAMGSYLPSIGMEVHAELLTRSKMFCRCPVSFGGEPNTRVCPVCLGLPGSLPVPNGRAVELVLRTALALDCKIAMRSVFHRKNYFYPDLPKGYQISQYEDTNPIGYYGALQVSSADGERVVRIRRVHLEEDTGKLMHLPGGGSGVDYNRAGVPLMEIVTDFPPDILSPEQARDYLQELRLVLIYLGACDGKMEEGSLRCEPNISIRPEGADKLGVKTELKNLNSFRSVQLGVKFEVERQAALLKGGQKVLQETRGWNEQRLESFSMRLKEEENDYRYFPDPDLPFMAFDESYVDGIRSALPELPAAKRKRYRTELGLSEYDASLLVADPAWAAFFEACMAAGGEPKATCNWMNGEFARHLKDSGQQVPQTVEYGQARAEVTKVAPTALVQLVSLVASGRITGKSAKEVFVEMFQTGKPPEEIVEGRGSAQIGDEEQIAGFVRQALAENPEAVSKYRSGQTAVKGFLVGQVMKLSQGRANPGKVNEIMNRELGS